MKQAVLDVLLQIAAGFRLFLLASLAAGLVAAVSVDPSAVDSEVIEQVEESSTEPEKAASDTEDSPEPPDDLSAHFPELIAPAAVSEVTMFPQVDGGRRGFHSRLPRPSGC